MKYDFDLAIIGAGSGGLFLAAVAANMGAKTLLIENHKMGGDCLNYGCVPSKTFLKSAHLAKQIRSSEQYGIKTSINDVSLKAVMQRVKDVIAEIAPHDSVERFTSLGVQVELGHGELVSCNEVKVNNRIFSAKNIAITTGSSPALPQIDGLDSVKYYTNENIFDLEELPKKLVVLGAGPIGLELGQGFANLGSETHMIIRENALFARDEPEVAPIMQQVLEEDGLILHFKTSIKSVAQDGNGIKVELEHDGKIESINADALLIAVGRVPNSKNLNLKGVGILTDSRGYIKVNKHLQTNVPNIFACGDVKGGYLFTHTASYEAEIVAKNALLYPMFKTDYSKIAWTTYTAPEVAHVGYLENEARKMGLKFTTQILPIDANDRAKAENDRHGFIKVILDSKSRLIGATIMGDKAGEMLPTLSLLVARKMKLSAVFSMIYQYPIQGEIVKSIAYKDFGSRTKAWQKTLLKKIVRSDCMEKIRNSKFLRKLKGCNL